MKLNDYSSKAELRLNIVFILGSSCHIMLAIILINTAFLTLHNILPFDATITSYLHRQCPPTQLTLYCLCALIGVYLIHNWHKKSMCIACGLLKAANKS